MLFFSFLFMIPIFLPSVRAEIRAFLNLATPLASAQVAQSVTGFIDTMMMGRLGAEHLAAGGLASLTFFSLLMTATGVVTGVSPLVAEAYGAGHQSRVSQLTSQGLWISLFLAIPIMLLVGQMGFFLPLLGQAANTVVLAESYLDIILWGAFPAIGFAMLRGVVSSLSYARPVMIIMIGGTICNVVGNYVLAFGKLGFPRMELAGLALASALSLWGMFLALVGYSLCHLHLRTYHLFQNVHQLRLRILWQLAWVGVPIGVSSALEIGLFLVVTYLMGTLGTETLAAHQIVFQTVFVIFMVPLGMSQATTVRVGQWFGKQSHEGERRAGYVGIGSAASFMTCVVIVLLLFPEQIVGIYLDTHDPDNIRIVTLAMSMLRVAAMAQIFDGVQKSATGALYGLQDTRIPVLLGLLAFWGIGLTSGYVLGFYVELGGVGLWIGQSIGVAIAAIFFVWRFSLKMNLENQPTQY